MKKSFFTALLSFVIINIYAQNFPGKKPELLLNKMVKPKIIEENLQKYGYVNFYMNYDKKLKQIADKPYDKKNKPFPTDPLSPTSSDYLKMVGKEFRVLEVVESIPKYSSSNKEYIIVIENEEIGKIYYKYDPQYAHNFELEVVGGLDYPEDFFCSEIKSENDKFDNKQRKITPTEAGISFLKITENDKSKIFLSISLNGRTLNVGGKGVNILFDDGSKFIKAETKIDVNVNSGSTYNYSAFIQLNDDEIKILSEKNITDKRLYIYDSLVDKESAKRIKEYLKCLTK